VQANLVARHERRALDWMCERIPRNVTPDALTLGGVAGAVLAFAGYCATWLDPAFVWLATLGIVVHWFGDSLDGSLARYRGRERPRYGYFLDHSVDAICNLAIMGGLGLSGFVRLDVALFVLCGYYLLCIHVFLYNHVSGVLRLSFLALGPTELRLGLVAINTWLYLAESGSSASDAVSFSAYDGFLSGVGFVFAGIFTYQTMTTLRMLRGREIEDELRQVARPALEHPHLQRAETNPSIVSK
jgi:phosphatidylglycerophosphate synthase